VSPNEAEMTEEEVYKEHLAAVNVAAHWAYLLSVLVGGFLLMVALIAVIGAGGG
jgi:hypothetical protein